MDQRSFASASGLRPMSAFVVIAVVIIVVAGRVVYLASSRDVARPDGTSTETGLVPAYEVADTRGRVLAHFVPRFDLVMSPRSMWQAHTPVHMAQRISETLGGAPTALELLDCMVPDAVDGVIEVKEWDLTARQANRLQEWIDTGAATSTRALDGMWIVALSGERRARVGYRLFWQPEVLLSKDERRAHGYGTAWAWARRIGTGIERCLRKPGVEEPDCAAEWEKRRAKIWAALVPRAHCKPVRGIPSELALEVRELLQEEAVAPWQMKLAYARDRDYPSGEHELFGDWGFTDPDQTEALPREGLELLCDRLLRREEWSFLDCTPSTYVWLRDRSIRGSRRDRANGFVGYSAPSEVPTVISTLDLALQREVGRHLDAVMEEHRPALAMGIVIDVRTGDVLAVESREQYTIQPFAPVYHTFTPGSTMKVMTMACALEEGVVRPGEELDVGYGEYRLIDPANGRSRIIHEAEGSLKGRSTAAMFFARSVNAALVQIGVRVPPDRFRDYLAQLGYGAPAGSGLGIEKAGYLRDLPWKYRFTHASVSFGHEMTTSLWQHAAALATVVRGGEWIPLRLVRAVEQHDVAHELPVPEGRRVFREETCQKVRTMMELGAQRGTGRHVARPDIVMGTKTGTAQKVATELCVHVELEARERWDRDGVACTSERYRSLRTLPKPHRNCYTSSMCIFGRLPDDDRELMVLVVVDEPRGKQKYGSKVAGPAAAAILAEALGLTRNGATPEPEVLAGFSPSDRPAPDAEIDPWRDGKEGL